MRAQLEALRGLDARILGIGDRLAIASADLCRDHAEITGIAVHSLGQYGPPYREVAAHAFGLDIRPAVLAADPDGPAGKAGVRADDILIAADGASFGSEPATAGASFGQTERTLDALDAAFADGAADLELSRSGQPIRLRVTAVPGCRGRFQLVPGGKLNAGADGRYIQISTALSDYVRSDDELAAILAHELAHNILRHRLRLDDAKVSRGIFKSMGRNARLIRETEVEADRLSVYLLDRAGYSIAAAANFWRRFGPEHGKGIFASPTHPGWRDRVAILEQEGALIARLKRTDPKPVPPFLQAGLTELK
jgi:hypothetical protein